MRGGRSPGHWDKLKRDLLEEIRLQAGATFSLGRTNGRWASGPRGVVGIVSGEERPEGDRWLMGLDERAMDGRAPIGVILLCETRDGKRIVLGFEASRWASLARGMSRDTARGELKFDLRRRGHRFLLAGEDVTPALDDLSWLGARAPDADQDRPGSPPAAGTPPEPPSVECRFFARVRGGALEPLDPPGLVEGDVVLVSAVPARAVPSNATLRRILAAGGPASLPADFADRHDLHAHGAQAS
jgi:hypothetical protein